MTKAQTQHDMRMAVLMHMGVSEPTARVLADIDAERGRQWEKWGDQSDMPDADPVLLARLSDVDDADYWRAPGAVARRLSEEYEVTTEERAKQIVMREVARDGGTWFGIAMEEVAEALDAIPQAMAR
jgi:hypothetical protein